IDHLRVATFALGYFASNFRCADDLALGVFDRRNGQRNVNEASVLALANGFVVFDALAVTNSLDDRFFLLLAIRLNKNRNPLTDDFLSQIAKNVLGTAVPARDDAVEVLADDCVAA